jgi:hypothetical protein
MFYPEYMNIFLVAQKVKRARVLKDKCKKISGMIEDYMAFLLIPLMMPLPCHYRQYLYLCAKYVQKNGISICNV